MNSRDPIIVISDFRNGSELADLVKAILQGLDASYDSATVDGKANTLTILIRTKKTRMSVQALGIGCGFEGNGPQELVIALRSLGFKNPEQVLYPNANPSTHSQFTLSTGEAR